MCSVSGKCTLPQPSIARFQSRTRILMVYGKDCPLPLAFSTEADETSFWAQRSIRGQEETLVLTCPCHMFCIWKTQTKDSDQKVASWEHLAGTPGPSWPSSKFRLCSLLLGMFTDLKRRQRRIGSRWIRNVRIATRNMADLIPTQSTTHPQIVLIRDR